MVVVPTLCTSHTLEAIRQCLHRPATAGRASSPLQCLWWRDKRKSLIVIRSNSNLQWHHAGDSSSTRIPATRWGWGCSMAIERSSSVSSSLRPLHETFKRTRVSICTHAKKGMINETHLRMSLYRHELRWRPQNIAHRRGWREVTISAINGDTIKERLFLVRGFGPHAPPPAAERHRRSSWAWKNDEKKKVFNLLCHVEELASRLCIWCLGQSSLQPLWLLQS